MTGQPAASPAFTRAAMAARLERLSIPEPNSGCWLWTSGALPIGYGRLKCSKRDAAWLGITQGTHYAHRVSYQTFVGPIPAGVEIDHVCTTKSCINPGHLEPVPHQENIRRGYANRRTRLLAAEQAAPAEAVR